MLVNALFLSGCAPGCAPSSKKAPDKPEPESIAPSERPPEPNAPPEKADEKNAPPESANEKNAPPESANEKNALFPNARPTSKAPTLQALRRRLADAERCAANNRLADAVENANYIVSQIRVAELHLRGSDGAGRNAREFEGLLNSALAALEDCAARSTASQSVVSPSEPTHVHF